VVGEAVSDLLASIAGWPARLQIEEVGGRRLELYVVADLERQLDRDRLLNDDAYVPPYWALLWSGSRILANFIARGGIDLAERTVLEVGCGMGLPSLAAAASGARVTAVDRAESALEFLRASAERNDFAIETVRGGLGDIGDRRFDHVIAAELLYETAEFPSLAETLVRLVRPGGELWIADAARVDTQPFFQCLARTGAGESLCERFEVVEEGTRVRIALRGYRAPITR
jgi:predicted nicotinamide N-methyase